MIYEKVDNDVTGAIRKGIRTLCADMSVGEPSDVGVYLQVPRNPSYGDLSCNAAIQLTKTFRKAPKEIALSLIDLFREDIKNSESSRYISAVSEAGGFINIAFNSDFYTDLLNDILKSGEDFGRIDMGGGRRIILEFVSANPTGPLTVAHGRQAAIGDSLAGILKFSGYSVSKEYYINDKGRQIDLLGESLKARCMQSLGRDYDIPENGYRGDYLADLAKEFIEDHGADSLLSGQIPDTTFRDFAKGRILSQIRGDLEVFGVTFDTWSSQEELESTGIVEDILSKLDSAGMVYENEGAVWLRSTEYGDSKDRVLIKNTKEMTYLTPDIAYHCDKFARGADNLVNLWGPDHHGYVPRVKAALSALGFDASRMDVLIIQLVTLMEGGTPVSMSTRAGQFVSLRELIDEVGRDATRFTYLLRRRDSHLEFDLDLAKKASLDNPVYYVQYAHARICSIMENVSEADAKSSLPSPFTEQEEIDIAKFLYQFPVAIRQSTETMDPYKVVDYLIQLAGKFHSFYAKHRVITDDADLTCRRVFLIKAIKQVLSNGLNLLGVGAPDKM